MNDEFRTNVGEAGAAASCSTDDGWLKGWVDDVFSYAIRLKRKASTEEMLQKIDELPQREKWGRPKWSRVTDENRLNFNHNLCEKRRTKKLLQQSQTKRLPSPPQRVINHFPVPMSLPSSEDDAPQATHDGDGDEKQHIVCLASGNRRCMSPRRVGAVKRRFSAVDNDEASASLPTLKNVPQVKDGHRDGHHEVSLKSNRSQHRRPRPALQLQRELPPVEIWGASAVRSPTANPDLALPIFYIAALSQVDQEVIDAARAAVGTQQLGFRSGAKIFVRFRLSFLPGFGPAGEPRAERVQLICVDLHDTRPADCSNGQGLCLQSTGILRPHQRVPGWLRRSNTIVPVAVLEEDVHSKAARKALSRPLRGQLRWSALFTDGNIRWREISWQGIPADSNPRLSAGGNGQITRQWLAVKNAETLHALVSGLAEETELVLSRHDSEGLCDVFLRVVGGIAPPNSTLWPKQSHEPSVSPGRRCLYTGCSSRRKKCHVFPPPNSVAAPEVAAQECRLKAIAIDCLTNLHLDDAQIMARVLPAVQQLKYVMSAAKSGAVASMQWRRLHEICKVVLPKSGIFQLSRSKAWMAKLYVTPPRYFRATCGVRGCLLPSHSATQKGDSYGLPGPRCGKHWTGYRCSVPGCERRKRAFVEKADRFGLAGSRCAMHGGGACNIDGCQLEARLKVPEEDEYGPAGRRCSRHANGMTVWEKKKKKNPLCSIDRCGRAGMRNLTLPDELGPPGWRCDSHGARACSLFGCSIRYYGGVQTSDQWGPPGLRCHIHGGFRCTVRDCRVRPRRKVTQADELGPPGLRCRAHFRTPQAVAVGREQVQNDIARVNTPKKPLAQNFFRAVAVRR